MRSYELCPGILALVKENNRKRERVERVQLIDHHSGSSLIVKDCGQCMSCRIGGECVDPQVEPARVTAS